MNSKKRLIKVVLVQVFLLVLVALAAEYGLRLVKSIVRDGGTVTLSRSSINSQADQEFGWFAPLSLIHISEPTRPY